MCKICKKNTTESLMSIFKQMESHPMCTDKFTEHLKDIKMYLINLFL